MPHFLFACFLATATVGGVYSQSCTNSFQQYLGCIKSNLDRDYIGLENDFKKSIYSKVNKCFSPTARDGSKCFFVSNQLDFPDAFGANGPLRKCKGCQRMVEFLRKKFVDLSPEEGTCLRRHLGAAIRNEVDPCVRRNTPGVVYTTPQIPDFDENMGQHKKDMMNNLERFILLFSRLDYCETKNKGKHIKTVQCLDNFRGGDYLRKHCAVMDSCSRGKSSGCSRFSEVERNTCKCIGEERQGIKNKVLALESYVRDVISETNRYTQSRSVPPSESSRKLECVSRINAILARDETPAYRASRNWMSFVDDAIKCIPGSKILNMNNLISIGCKKLVAVTDLKDQEISVMIHFIINMVDALIERVGRFCSDSC